MARRSCSPTGTTSLLVIDHPLEAAICTLVGLAFVLLAAATRGLGALQGLIARRTARRRGGQLEARVTQLDVARGAAVDTADAERRRIERDLHDGAQQRLVALAHEPRPGAKASSTSDPEAARRAGRDAHEEAKARSPSCATWPAASTRRS